MAAAASGPRSRSRWRRERGAPSSLFLPLNLTLSPPACGRGCSRWFIPRMNQEAAAWEGKRQQRLDAAAGANIGVTARFARPPAPPASGRGANLSTPTCLHYRIFPAIEQTMNQSLSPSDIPSHTYLRKAAWNATLHAMTLSTLPSSKGNKRTRPPSQLHRCIRTTAVKEQMTNGICHLCHLHRRVTAFKVAIRQLYQPVERRIPAGNFVNFTTWLNIAEPLQPKCSLVPRP
jgi:hypothetical protein